MVPAVILSLALGTLGVVLAVWRLADRAKMLRLGIRSMGEVVREERRGQTSSPNEHAGNPCRGNRRERGGSVSGSGIE